MLHADLHTMKFALALFIVLAIIGLDQSHQFPDFGKGPLHEDRQDIHELIPTERIVQVAANYLQNNAEEKATVKFLETMPESLRNLEYVEPTLVDLVNYIQDANIDIKDFINELNKLLKIKKLVPPESTLTPTFTFTSTSSAPTP